MSVYVFLFLATNFYHPLVCQAALKMIRLKDNFEDSFLFQVRWKTFFLDVYLLYLETYVDAKTKISCLFSGKKIYLRQNLPSEELKVLRNLHHICFSICLTIFLILGVKA